VLVKSDRPREDADADLQAPIIARIKENPDLSDLSFRVFENRERVRKLTRGPWAIIEPLRILSKAG
jgi:hypothetical protein